MATCWSSSSSFERFGSSDQLCVGGETDGHAQVGISATETSAGYKLTITCLVNHRFLILYVISGVFGFVLGGNFALAGLASMGASGAIFGTHAAVLVDLIWHWKLFDKPGRMLLALGFEVIVGFGLGAFNT